MQHCKTLVKQENKDKLFEINASFFRNLVMFCTYSNNPKFLIYSKFFSLKYSCRLKPTFAQFKFFLWGTLELIELQLQEEAAVKEIFWDCTPDK